MSSLVHIEIDPFMLCHFVLEQTIAILDVGVALKPASKLLIHNLGHTCSSCTVSCHLNQSVVYWIVEITGDAHTKKKEAKLCYRIILILPLSCSLVITNASKNERDHFPLLTHPFLVISSLLLPHNEKQPDRVNGCCVIISVLNHYSFTYSLLPLDWDSSLIAFAGFPLFLFQLIFFRTVQLTFRNSITPN